MLFAIMKNEDDNSWGPPDWAIYVERSVGPHVFSSPHSLPLPKRNPERFPFGISFNTNVFIILQSVPHQGDFYRSYKDPALCSDE
jgi:hypothetical protein